MIESLPDNIRRVPVSGHARHHSHKYRRPLRKTFRFAVRDGLFETVRKVRSKLVERRVEAAQQILVCSWDDNGAHRIAVTRDLGGTPRFHPELVFDAPDGLVVDDVVLPADLMELLESYLPVPECPLADRVAGAVRSANPGLRGAAMAPGSDQGGEEPGIGAGAGAGTGAGAAPGPTPGAGDRIPGPAKPQGRVFLLGYGGYVREQVLPAFGGRGGVMVAGAVDHKAELLRSHHRGDFPLYRDLELLLPAVAVADRPLVIIATYHSDHARSALAVLDANPDARVFIEKPATVTVAEAESLAERRAAGAWIDIGFNRRYAAMTGDLVSAARRLPRPLVFSALVKELKLPGSHWYHWPNQGTRVTGNLCHWIDLAHLLVGDECVSVRALGAGSGDAPANGETVSAILGFADGSVATLVGTDAGDDLGGVMEHMELRGGETTVVVDDYRRLIREEDGRRRVRRSRREKGHGRMYRELRGRWLDGAGPAYPVDDMVAVARTTARIVDAVADSR